MAIRLKQSTASQEIPLGVFVDDTDGKTAKTGLTIANTDIKLWKMGATSLADKNSGGATHISGGIYYAVLDATDTDTLGGLVIFVHVSGALPVRVECEVLAANVYDSLIAASDKLQVHTDEITNNLITASTIATGAIDADAIADGAIDAGALASDAITAAKIASDAVTEIQSGLATAANLSTVAGYLDTEVAAILADTNELQTDLADGGRLDLLIDAIKARTDNLPSDPADDSDIDAQLAAIAATLGTAGDGLTAVVWNAAWDAEVQSEVADALAVYDPPTKAELDSGLDALPTAAENADAVWEEAIADHSGASGSTAEQLSAAGSAGDPWATALPGSYTSGQAGKIVGDNLNATVSSRSSHSAADVWAVGTRALTDKANFSLSSAGIQAIWDALTSALTTATSIGKLLVDNINATISSRLASASYTAPDNTSITEIKARTDNLPSNPAATDDIPSAASIADAVWDEATTNHTNSGTFGEQLKTDVDAILVDTGTTLQGELDGIQAGTEDIQSRLPTALVSGRMDSNVQAMGSDVITSSALAASAVTEIQSGLSTLTAADINAEVVDVIRTDVIPDSVAAKGSRPTVAQALLMISRLLMEKSISNTTVTVKKEDGSTSSMTFTLDDASNPTSITRAS